MVIWRITDHKPGHDSQSRGLCEALGRQTAPLIYHDIPADALKLGLVNFLLRRYPPGNQLEKPQLIIGAGHKTHLPILCAKRAYGGKTVVLMKPSLPLKMFDYALIPAHDSPEVKDNILITEGAINSIIPSKEHEESRGIILIGGPSKHYAWDEAMVINQVIKILEADSAISWLLADSPRTPLSFSSRLASLAGANASYQSWKHVNRDWISKELRKSGRAWVTEDSVSMIYEALTAGAATGVIKANHQNTNKIADNINRLKEKEMITDYETWLASGFLPQPLATLDEATRGAEWLLRQL